MATPSTVFTGSVRLFGRSRFGVAGPKCSPAPTIFAVACALTGCPSPTTTASQPAKISPDPINEDEGCRLAEGPASDPTIAGAARSEPELRCCASRYGFDPQLARERCGFADYLGESEEFACVHRFRDDGGEVHELRITPLVGVDLERALQLHRAGLERDDSAAPPGLDELSWSSAAGYRWAFVPGWPNPRRLGWEERACAPADMLPVLAAMAAAEPEPDYDAGRPLPPLEVAGEDEEPVAIAGLLAHHGEQTPARPELDYPLPRRAHALVLDTLRAAAADDREAFAARLRPDARWGLPDRRRLGARPILADEGRQALTALRRAAARIGDERELTCPTFDRRLRAPISRGELPMWCYWMGAEGNELLVFALRGQIDDGRASARVEYIGLFPEPPRGPVLVHGEPPAPPLYPQPELVCGDPHAKIVDPGLCPEEEPEADEDDESGPEEGEAETDDSPETGDQSEASRGERDSPGGSPNP